MINFNLVSNSIGDNSVKVNSIVENQDSSFKGLLNEDSLGDKDVKSELVIDSVKFSRELEDFLLNLDSDIDLNDEEIVENIALGLFVYKVMETVPKVEISESIGLKEIETNFEDIMDYFISEKEGIKEFKNSISLDENVSKSVENIIKVFESLLKIENTKDVSVKGNLNLERVDLVKNEIVEISTKIESIIKEFISNEKEIKNNVLSKMDSLGKDSNVIDNSENSSLNYILKELSKVKDIVSVVVKGSQDSPINTDKENYNNFLLNQRIGMVNEGIEDVDLKSKIEEISSTKSNNEVNIGLSQHTYRTDTIINGKINPTVTYGYIQKDVLVQEIPKVITNMNTEGLNEIVLKVKPKELGEISIHLTKSSDIANVVITVESDELFNITKRGLLDISAQLKEIGMKVDNITIQMKENNQNANMDFMTNSESSDFKNNNGNSKNNSNKLNLDNSDDLEAISLNNQSSDEINILA